jgi:F-type H+-transporting ATPase subunit a
MLLGAPLLFGSQSEVPPPAAAAESHDAGIPHPPTLVSLAADLVEGRAIHDPEDVRSPVAGFLLRYTAPIFSAIVIVLLGVFFASATRRLTMVPGRAQNLVEMIVETFDGFVQGVIGPEGRRFVPFLGTIFIYVYVMNILGLVPLMFSPTSVIETTLGIAVCVFLYVQWTGIRTNGPVGYLRHLAGDPKSIVEWCMVPLLMPIHVIGELSKPVSLSLRLFGNIMGGETLLAVFMGLGVGMLAFTGLPVGIPIHVPFMFLELLVTLIQALVFTLLSTIYFALIMPHHEHEEGHHA